MTNDSRPVQRPASNSTARKRDEDARAVSYSWPLSEAQVAALVERLEAERDAYREEVAKAAALRATERVAPTHDAMQEALHRYLTPHPSLGTDADDRGCVPCWLIARNLHAALFAAQPTVADVKAQALREEASDVVADCVNQSGPCVCVARYWLRDRADRIGGGA